MVKINTRIPRGRERHICRSPAVLVLVSLLLTSCGPTYPESNITQAVIDLCRKEYNVDIEASLVGKTLYTAINLDNLVDTDLQLQSATLDKLEGTMLNTTRVALSSDADIDFLVTKARDTRLGVEVELIRYLPDVKSLIYMRISRSDFGDRLVMETKLGYEDKSEWKDIYFPDFLSRLIASRISRQLTSNPLVTVFLQVSRVTGEYAEDKKTVYITLDKFNSSKELNVLIDEILSGSVNEVVYDVVKKYDARNIIETVEVNEESGRHLMTVDLRRDTGKEASY